jgi:hypothetical protein
MERYILEIDDVLPRDFCEDVISRFEIDERKTMGSTINGVNEKVKKSVDLGIVLFPKEWDDVLDKVGNCVNSAIDKYKEHLIENALDRNGAIGKTIKDSTIGLPQIQKTEKNGFYGWHHDGHFNRIFTYIFYLNDVEEGTGGTTEFLCGKIVQPKAGKLVIFPATLTYIHRGTKLKEGVKYIMTNFIYKEEPILEHPYAMGVNNTQNLTPIEKEISKPENDDI